MAGREFSPRAGLGRCQFPELFPRHERMTARRSSSWMRRRPNEDCRPWLHVQRLFHGAGVHVPEVLAQDLERGFLLLSDLGNTTYLQALTPETPSPLYADAIAALIGSSGPADPGAARL
jgi:aminoglycoside/choline kinase family phosphotransferase